MNKLHVLYEDNHIIVVEKAPNILSQADSTGDLDLLTMVKSYIKQRYHKPGNVYLGLVHRLDRPVGGVMVFARTSKAASRLSKQIQMHTVKKKYLAIVHGKMDLEGKMVDFLERLENGKTVISSRGKRSELSYRLLSYCPEENISLVEVILKTGRHHQIRVQFASRGHALCGDQKYGVMDKTPIALFAYSLSFFHPVTGEIMNFSLQPPKFGYWTKFTL